MNPLRDDNSEPLQVWKRSLPEDEQYEPGEDMDESVRHGVIASMVVICGVIITVVIAIAATGVYLFLKHKQIFGL